MNEFRHDKKTTVLVRIAALKNRSAKKKSSVLKPCIHRGASLNRNVLEPCIHRRAAKAMATRLTIQIKCPICDSTCGNLRCRANMSCDSTGFRCDSKICVSNRSDLRHSETNNSVWNRAKSGKPGCIFRLFGVFCFLGRADVDCRGVSGSTGD